MRILVDLQAAQTESRFRGIGRYSGGLFRGLARTTAPPDELMVWLDGTYPAEAARVREELCSDIPNDAVRYGYYPWPQEFISDAGDVLRAAARAMHRHGHAQLAPDVLHISSLFEGYVEPACVGDNSTGLPRTLSSVTLYDLIPAKLPDWYLRDPAYAGWYRRKLQALRRFDVMLCISEATRQDAMSLLELPSDRFAVIDSGIDHGFFRLPTEGERLASGDTLAKFGIDREYVLYTGNGDPRKNVRRAIEAFAALPSHLRQRFQLVLNQVADKEDITRLVTASNMRHDAVVVTGHVSDGELRDLIWRSRVFFFPSLYEGFGLPVLEAMACGIPTICSNQSSLPEVVANPEATFDPNSVVAMRDKLAQVLESEDFQGRLMSRGLDRSALYTWDRSARLARESWNDRLSGASARVWPAFYHGRPRHRIAIVTPLPPEETGIAKYMVSLLDALAVEFDVDLYTTAALEKLGSLTAEFRIHPVEKLRENAYLYDQVIYQMGNSPFHTQVLSLLPEIPGILVLHDLFASSLLAYLQRYEGRGKIFEEELAFSHGRGAASGLSEEEAWEQAKILSPASGRLIRNSDAILMHSQHGLAQLRAHFPYIERGSLFNVPLPVVESTPSPSGRHAARCHLGLKENDILIISAGFVADTKMSLEIAVAIKDVEVPHGKRIVLAFVGANEGGDYGRRLDAQLKKFDGSVRGYVSGFVSPEDYSRHLDAADIAIQLRCRSRGESSLTVLECMSHGVPLIANEYGSIAELPEGTYYALPPEVTLANLTDAVGKMVADTSLRENIATNATQYVRQQCSPSKVAEAYRIVVDHSILARRERNGEVLEQSLLSAFREYPSEANTQYALEAALVNLVNSRPGRIFVDVSDYVQQDYGTGIHRVVKNVLREMVLNETAASPVTPFVVDSATGVAYEAQPAADALVGHSSARDTPEVNIQAGDVVYLLDSTWSNPERFDGILSRAREVGARISVMVYDLIPLRYPQFCVDYMPGIFERWLRYVLRHADVVTCISQSVADDLANWIEEQSAGLGRPPGQLIVSTPLGADPPWRTKEEVSQIRLELEGFLRDGHVGAMVGTVEPRKRQDLVLEAYRQLWRDYPDIGHKLLIVGKQGWNVSELADVLLAERPERLLWLWDATDAEVQFVYQHAERIIQASDAEGYGLPIIEALEKNAAVLASDIPVFREIAGNNISYFKKGNVGDLVRSLLVRPKPGSPIPNRSWEAAARSIVAEITGNTRY